MTTSTIPVQGTYDIALGRRTLRQKISNQRWEPTFNARAAAALTAMGELILLGGLGTIVPVTIRVFEESDLSGVEFSCSLDTAQMDNYRLDETMQRLVNVTDELNMQENGRGHRLTAQVWCLVKGKRHERTTRALP